MVCWSSVVVRGDPIGLCVDAIVLWSYKNFASVNLVTTEKNCKKCLCNFGMIFHWN